LCNDSLDPEIILHSLGRSEPAIVTSAPGGADASIWQVEQGNETIALRLLQPEQAQQAAREVSALECARAGGIPVPRLLKFITWNKHPVLLLEWIEGVTLAERLIATNGDFELSKSFGRKFGAVQAAIHRIAAPPTLGANWWDWPNSLPEVPGILGQMQRNCGMLIHLDFHPRNTMVDGDEIVAVLDWANAHAGDPRADVARTLSILQNAPIPENVVRVDVKAILDAFETGWKAGYLECGGSMDDLAPYCWWAGRAMEHDLAPKVGQPGLPWLTSGYLDQVRLWTQRWKAGALAGS
jgi:aminoglycoside phosphotransferase (APT) family kinase protein